MKIEEILQFVRKVRFKEKGGREFAVPSWATSMFHLGWAVSEESEKGRRALIIMMVPSRRFAPSFLMLGSSTCLASKEHGGFQYSAGDQVQWVEGGRIAEGVYHGPDLSNQNMIRIVQKKRNGSKIDCWKSSWDIFPKTTNIRGMIADLGATSEFRGICPHISSIRSAAKPASWLLTQGETAFNDAESLALSINHHSASLRQLLLWRKDGGISFTRPFAGSSAPDYRNIDLAVLDGEAALKHLEHDERGNRLVDGKKSIVVLVREDEYVRARGRIEEILRVWGGKSIDDHSDFSRFRDIYGQIPEAGVIHHFAFVWRGGNV